jgi:hypothetical protein
MTEIKLNKTDIEKGMRNEERNEAMNMMNSAQKANSKEFNKGYDAIKWDGKSKPKQLPALEWYAYLHVDGGIHVKRYRAELQRGDINEAIESDFVIRVVGPYEAKDRNDAIKIAKEKLNADA